MLWLVWYWLWHIWKNNHFSSNTVIIHIHTRFHTCNPFFDPINPFIHILLSKIRIAQDIFKKCDQNGFITPKTVTQLYCQKHDSFLADRFVEGICPHCAYPDARGDQCDSCQKLLNATDLIKPRLILNPFNKFLFKLEFLLFITMSIYMNIWKLNHNGYFQSNGFILAYCL